MALDMNGMLPGADGLNPKKKNAKSGCIVFLTIILILIIAGLFLARQKGIEITDFSSRSKPGSTETANSKTTATIESVKPENKPVNPVPDIAEIKDPPAESTPSKQPDQIAATSGSKTNIMTLWKKVEDNQKSGNTADMIKLLKEIHKTHSSDAHGATALLRLGLAARKSGDEITAQKYFRNVYTELPETTSGRLSSLILADLWYQKYVMAPTPEHAKWEAVRDAYSNTMGRDDVKFLNDKILKRIVSRLNKLNKSIIFSRRPCVGSKGYVVKQNDRLQTIAQKHGVHFDGIALINSIKAPHYYIRVGEKLKILKLPAEVQVDKSDMTLTLYLGGKWIKQYQICHGGQKTPTGKFTIATKSADPSWTDPETRKVYKSTSKKNILGSRWLGFGGDGPGVGLGVHGTTLPHSIPGSTSNGCVRMLNSNVEEIYGLVLIGSTVIIKD
ncbi:MAG: L,D-transpeptidase family protein [Planctomycetota bacterium]|jgi:hypothetical protein